MSTDTIFTVLAWFVLATLAIGIARQLSEQIHIYEYSGSYRPAPFTPTSPFPSVGGSF